MYSVYALAAIAPLAYAYTQPTEATFGALLTPDLSSPVTQGETYSVTWDATGHEKATVSLVLCRGDSTNCVNDKNAIVEAIPAGKESYEWAVPCSLTAGKQATSTGYGMLIIEDGTGIFQYSTQFSVLANDKCGSASSTTEDGPTGTLIPAPTGKNGTISGGPGKNSTWATASEQETTKTPTVLPTQAPETGLAGGAQTSTSMVWSTATQPSSTSATPAVSTGDSGAGRNAAGALFLGAVGAAFML